MDLATGSTFKAIFAASRPIRFCCLSCADHLVSTWLNLRISLLKSYRFVFPTTTQRLVNLLFVLLRWLARKLLSSKTLANKLKWTSTASHTAKPSRRTTTTIMQCKPILTIPARLPLHIRIHLIPILTTVTAAARTWTRTVAARRSGKQRVRAAVPRKTALVTG
jgi:hypothetical protein